jgi:hypothetical protein
VIVVAVNDNEILFSVSTTRIVGDPNESTVESARIYLLHTQSGFACQIREVYCFDNGLSHQPTGTFASAFRRDAAGKRNQYSRSD